MATGSGAATKCADWAVKDWMHDKATSLKRELSMDSETADERLSKKLKLERGPIVKSKTH